jgi:hypothetical protein
MKTKLTAIARLSRLKQPLRMVGDPPLEFQDFETRDAVVYQRVMAEKRKKSSASAAPAVRRSR